MIRRVLVLVSFVVVCTYASTLSRKKRRLDQMSEMFRTVSGGKLISMMNDYGGWCGLGGAGVPKDKIDRCCMIHDHCYDKLFETACKDSSMPAAPYLLSYKYRIENGRPKCDKVNGSHSHCAFSICKCDTSVVKCWMKHLDEYNPSLKSQSVTSKLVNQAIDILMKTLGSSPESVSNDTSSSLVNTIHHTVNKTLKTGSSLMSQLSDILEKTVKAYSEVFLVRKRDVD